MVVAGKGSLSVLYVCVFGDFGAREDAKHFAMTNIVPTRRGVSGCFIWVAMQSAFLCRFGSKYMFITDPTSFSTVYLHPSSRISLPPPQHRSRMIFLRRFPRHSLLRWTVTVLRAGGRWCTSCTSPSLPVLRASVLVPPVFLICFTSRPSPVVNKHLSVRHRRSFATCYCQASLAVFALLIRRIRQLVFVTLSDIFYTAPRHHPFRCRPPPGASVHVVILFLSS